MHPGQEARPICTLRSAEEQHELWIQGRGKPGSIVTWIDGITKIGAHNPIPGKPPLSRAIDIGVFIDGKYMTKSVYYLPFRVLAKKYGLKSGWDFGDPPHIQVAVGAVVLVKK